MELCEQKWKTYALSLVLSEWDETPAPVLFDFLTTTDVDSLSDLFEEHEISIWQPLEDLSYIDLIDLIVSIATQAQHTAETT